MPSSSDPWVGAVVLPPEPASVAAARRVVARACAEAGVPHDALDAAVLLASEVVTNAIVHGRSEASLTVRAAADRVRVEVADDNSRTPVIQQEDPDALDGRGLAIVAVCADAWGVEALPYGKVVWFEILLRRG